MSKKQSSGVIVIVLAAVLSVSSSCSKKGGGTEWRATIETVDGVKTVRNPGTPRYGEFAFDLAEDLAIGDEKDEAYYFPRGVSLNVDDDGTIYACDFGNKRVQVYDRNGKYVRTIGRQGQGPGEYRSPSSVLLDEAGNPYVYSPRTLVAFTREGTFLKNVPLKTFLSQLMLGPNGTVVGTTQPNPRAEGGPKNELVQLGPDGERLRTLAEYPVYGVSKDQVLNHWYTGDISFCRRSETSLYYGFSLEYTVHVVDAEGRALLAFSKEEKALPITGAEKDLTRKEGIFAWDGSGDPEKADLGLPDHRPFFFNFLSDDAGRLYVVRFRSILEKNKPERLIDVFSKDGIHLYTMTWNLIPAVIKGGCLYEVRENQETGDYKIVRHRVRNWNDFKEK